MKKVFWFALLVLSINVLAVFNNKVLLERLKKYEAEQKYGVYYAEAFMTFCTDKNWKNTEIMYYVANAYEQLGNYYREREILLKALRIKPNDKKLKEKLNFTEKKIAKLEKKIKYLHQQPEEVKIYTQLAAIYIGLKDYTNARIYLNKANMLDSRKENIIHRLMEGAFQKQIEIPTRKAIELSSKALDAYDKGNKEQAYNMFRSAFALSISSPFVYDNYAELLLKDNNYGGAIRALEESYFLRKSASKAIDIGNLYFIKGDYTTAFDYFQEATRLNGKASEAYYNIALCLEKLGDKKGAEKYYEKAYKMNPKLKNRKKSPLRIHGVLIKFKTKKNSK